MNPNWYYSSTCSDNEGYICGYDWDIIRWAEPSNVGAPVIKKDDLNDNGLYGGDCESRFGSAHPAGCNFLYCDGSVRQVHYGVDYLPFSYACNRKDGQTVNLDDF